MGLLEFGQTGAEYDPNRWLRFFNGKFRMPENTVTNRPKFISPIPPIPYRLFSNVFLPLHSTPTIFWNRRAGLSLVGPLPPTYPEVPRLPWVKVSDKVQQLIRSCGPPPGSLIRVSMEASKIV